MIRPLMPVNEMLPAVASSETHCRVASESMAKPKLTWVRLSPKAFAVPPFSPAKAETSFPPIVSRSTARLEAFESVTVVVDFSTAKPPLTEKKSNKFSVKLPETRSSSPAVAAMFRLIEVAGPVVTTSGLAA